MLASILHFYNKKSIFFLSDFNWINTSHNYLYTNKHLSEKLVTFVLVTLKNRKPAECAYCARKNIVFLIIFPWKFLVSLVLLILILFYVFVGISSLCRSNLFTSELQWNSLLYVDIKCAQNLHIFTRVIILISYALTFTLILRKHIMMSER